MGLRRDISNQIHNTLLDGHNSVRSALGLAPKKDYGCAYDQNERQKQRQLESHYYYEDDDDYYKRRRRAEEDEEERRRKYDDDWD